MSVRAQSRITTKDLSTALKETKDENNIFQSAKINLSIKKP